MLMFGIVLERFINIVKETLLPGSSQRQSYYSNTPIITLGGESINSGGGASGVNINCDNKNQRKTGRLSDMDFDDAAAATDDDNNINNGEKKLLILPEDGRVMLPAVKVSKFFLIKLNDVCILSPRCVLHFRDTYANQKA